MMEKPVQGAAGHSPRALTAAYERNGEWLGKPTTRQRLRCVAWKQRRERHHSQEREKGSNLVATVPLPAVEKYSGIKNRVEEVSLGGSVSYYCQLVECVQREALLLRWHEHRTDNV